MQKSISQRFKKSKKFAFRNSPFTRQHNISLNGTKSKIFDRVCRICFTNKLTCEARALNGTTMVDPFTLLLEQV